MISDVLLKAIQEIERYQRESPDKYDEYRDGIEIVKGAMKALQCELDIPPPTPTELARLGAYLKPLVIDPDLCDGTLKHTRKWLKDRNREDAISWLQSQGGHCDCEVWYNVPPRGRRYRAHVLKPGEAVTLNLDIGSVEVYSPEFNEELKEAIRGRDDYRCAICGGWGNSVHHINYYKADNWPENLITLCTACHAKTNNNRGYWRKRLTPIALDRQAKICYRTLFDRGCHWGQYAKGHV